MTGKSTQYPKKIIILMADDDDDDFMLAQKALSQSDLPGRLVRVKDGEELMEYLRREGDYKDPEKSPRPGVILLDLNMPKMDGREALGVIKSDDKLSNIPVIIFTTSSADDDVYRSYKLGVNSFITKPVQFKDLIEVMYTFRRYWFDIVELPKEADVRG